MKTSSFVEQLYTKFLGRSADTAGRDFWEKLLDDGTVTAAQATHSFIESDEFSGLATPIARLYYAAFNRIPDADGLAFWMAQAKKGASVTAIAADFTRSNEFQTLYGKKPTDTAFVDLLYKNVLGRTADAEGKAFWLAKLSKEKVPREVILNAFSDSPELVDGKNFEIKIVIQYQSIANITPSKTQIDAAIQQNDALTLITDLYASTTYTGEKVPYLNSRGVVVDGYMDGASIFVDRNGNYLQDANEATIKSDLQGSFAFAGKESFNGVLVSTGGTDISTTHVNPLTYTAPAGSFTISPLSTLLENMAHTFDTSYTQAQGILNEKLGLGADWQIADIDPIAQSVAPLASAELVAQALKAQQMSALVNMNAKMLASIALATGLSPDAQQASALAFHSINKLITGEVPEGQTNFADLDNLGLLLDHAAELATASAPQLDLINNIKADYSVLMMALNQQMLDAVVADAPVKSGLSMIAQIEYVADGLAQLLLTDAVDGDIGRTVSRLGTLQDTINAALPHLGPLTQDITAPKLLSSNPADNAAPVLADSNIVLMFDENVFAGTGTILLTNGKDSRSIDISDSTQISFTGRNLTINPSEDLVGGTSYSVTMEAGVVRDRVSNLYAGISDSTTLNFSVPNSVLPLSGLNGSTGMRFDGTAPTGIVSAGGPGDINGDGYSDFILGSSSNTNTGSSYIMLGKSAALTVSSKLSSLDSRSGFRADGVAFEDFSGSSVSMAGDINGDGYTDIIIGAPGADPATNAFAGSSYILFGKKTAFSSGTKLSSLDGKSGFRLDAANNSEWSGSSVSGAGDVNGDGLDDFLIGADGGNNITGAAYLIFGKKGTYAATLNLSTLDGSTGFKMNGVGSSDNAGAAVAGVGDFNGDGLADMLIGGFGANGGDGAAWLVFGSAGTHDASMNLAALDGISGLRFNGTAGEGLGRSVSAAGDLNGDGLADLVIGAFHADADAGTSYVVYGSNAGFEASFDMASLDGSNGFRIHGEEAGDLSGIAVSRAGDVNGDGIGDLLIGARNAHGGQGASYILFGNEAGFEADMYLSKLNGVNGFRLDGKAGEQVGSSVSAAGDMNGDGFDDIVIGAQTGTGTAYLFLGGNFSNVVTHQGTIKADTLTGTDAAENFAAGQGDDIITPGAGADVIHAGAGNDTIIVSSFDFKLLDGGGGTDILKFDGEGINLDLTAMGSKIHCIETFNIAGSGDNVLTLSAQAILRQSEYSNTVKVLGNAGDTLHLVGTWSDGGTGRDGHTWQQGEAIVIVAAALTVDFI